MRPIFMLIALFLVILISVEFFRWKSGKARMAEVLTLQILLLMGLFGVIFPSFLDFMTALVGMQLRAFFFFTLSVFILAAVCFSLYLRSEKQQQMVVRLVQSIALMEEQIRRQGKSG